MSDQASPEAVQSAVPIATQVPVPAPTSEIPATPAPEAQLAPVSPQTVPPQVPAQPVQSAAMPKDYSRPATDDYLAKMQDLSNAVYTVQSKGVVAPPEIQRAWQQDAAQNIDPNSKYAGFHAESIQAAAQNQVPTQSDADCQAMERKIAAEQAALQGTPAAPAPTAQVPAAEAAPVAQVDPTAPAPVATEPVQDRPGQVKLRPVDEDEAHLLNHAEFIRRQAAKNGVQIRIEDAIKQARESSQVAAPAPAAAPVIPQIEPPPALPEGPSAAELAAQAHAESLKYADELGQWHNDAAAEHFKRAAELNQAAQTRAQLEAQHQQVVQIHQQAVAQQQFNAESQQAYQMIPALADNNSRERQTFDKIYAALSQAGDSRAFSPVQLTQLTAFELYRQGQTQQPTIPAQQAAPAVVAPVAAPAMQAPSVAQQTLAPVATPPRPAPPPIGRASAPAAPAPSPLQSLVAAKTDNPYDFEQKMMQLNALIGRR